MIGQTLSHYRIVEKLGEGGMGVLYRAVDTRLGRDVAIKLLRPEAVGSAERRERFVREAKAASALSHPHIITIHDIGRETVDGVERDFIVMEYVKGRSLDEVVAEGPLPKERVLEIATETADALSAAHESGIVHRDVKPANLMITDKGHVKVVDFGLAKLVERADSGESAPTMTAGHETEKGVVLGTAAYMSPEQAEGKPVDARSDVFSLGVVLYQMLTGRRPFEGDSHVSTRLAILNHTPPPPRALQKDVPAELERAVLKCLEKQKEKRCASAAELLVELRRLQSRPVRSRRRILVPAGVVLLALAAAGAWWGVRSSRVRWARDAVSEITRLMDRDQHMAAFRIAREAKGILPEDAELQGLWTTMTWRGNVETNPPGASAYWRDYADVDGEWEHAGTTPIQDAELPTWVYQRWRFTMDGFDPVEGGSYPFLVPTVDLHPIGETPSGMVHVPAGSYRVGSEDPVELEEYWLDRYEVTNRQYQQFVDAGGYEESDFWKHPFVDGSRELFWEEAVARFVDETGRPGPSPWRLGSYPDGEGDFPVRGVSWYEAAALCEFSAKSLPTVYHWLKATDRFGPPAVLELSNFGGKGPAPVGKHQGLGPFGTYDMAGNVKEWALNPSGDLRFILGGSWDEPVYMYRARHAQPPFDRDEDYGLRCARFEEPLSDALTRPIDLFWRDYAKEKPASDEVFEVYRSIYSYDRTELYAKAEPVDSGSPHWTKERIEFDAAYGGERMIAYLFLPANAAPPYQTVVYFPGSGAEVVDSHENGMWYVDFLIRSGRALLYPIYKGTFERRGSSPAEGPSAERDRDIQRFKDLARSLDYLQSREDIDRERIAYYGFSWGAYLGPIFTALDERFAASILAAGGFDWDTVPAEVDPFHFAPRATTPVLMINGRDDFRFPLELSQKPMFRALGAPEKDKRHALIDGGHVPGHVEVIKETLDWLDRYLGKVTVKRP